ncbi:triosephosphate isomerase [Silvibacterium bohemicum]|uniref:Triosephosphate isomerase n=1 Tax=Silvibacterium bohemicum TaxID=1577686 RepID=A0A841JYF1_9BACT|nr:triose-phosphate isomerase [Silvibacterium bohemicum]MBB6146483.1 triosephosphate isomerase [Silvibacterium bohemicum]
MSRKPLIAANWKMYKTPAQAQEFVKTFLPLVANHDRDEIVLCPSMTSLSVVIAAVSGSNVAVGAQNMHYAGEGAFTGETSALMLNAIGTTHVLIGHSERRQYFAETDETVNKKIHCAIKHHLTPILCVGEQLEEREAGKTEEVLMRQTENALKGVEPAVAKNFIVAYEPVWAIGTGRTATPEMAGMAHFFIRSEIARLLGRKTADSIRILYGGSVKPDNASALLNQPEIDGALVGGASLDPQSFAEIVKY